MKCKPICDFVRDLSIQEVIYKIIFKNKSKDWNKYCILKIILGDKILKF